MSAEMEKGSVLGGMILARLVAGDVDPLTTLPIVDRPLPWLGVEPVRSMAVRLAGWALEGLGTNPVR